MFISLFVCVPVRMFYITLLVYLSVHKLFYAYGLLRLLRFYFGFMPLLQILSVITETKNISYDPDLFSVSFLHKEIRFCVIQRCYLWPLALLATELSSPTDTWASNFAILAMNTYNNMKGKVWRGLIVQARVPIISSQFWLFHHQVTDIFYVCSRKSLSLIYVNAKSKFCPQQYIVSLPVDFGRAGWGWESLVDDASVFVSARSSKGLFIYFWRYFIWTIRDTCRLSLIIESTVHL